jgi:hypothetical protein
LRVARKWDRVRLALNDGKTGEEGPIPVAPSTTGRPIGTKKAKAERNVGSSSGGFEAGVGLFVDSMNANSKELYDRSDARWKEIKETQKKKLVIRLKRIYNF